MTRVDRAARSLQAEGQLAGNGPTPGDDLGTTRHASDRTTRTSDHLTLPHHYLVDQRKCLAPRPGGQGVAGSNPAVPTVFRTLMPLTGNESSHDHSHLSPAGRAQHPRQRPPSCRRPPGRHSHSAVRPPPAGRPPAHDEDDRHHPADRLSPHQAQGPRVPVASDPRSPRRAVAERRKLTDVATLDLRHFTSCAPKAPPPRTSCHRRPPRRRPGMDGAALTLPHRTSIRLTPEPPSGAAHRIKASRQTSDSTDRHDLRCFTRPLSSLAHAHDDAGQ